MKNVVSLAEVKKRKEAKAQKVPEATKTPNAGKAPQIKIKTPHLDKARRKMK